MDVKEIDEKIKNRTITHNGNLHDIGIILDQISTKDLVDYYIYRCGESEHPIRYFLEQGIINGIMSSGINQNERLHRPI